MLVVMQSDATQTDIDRVCSAIKEMGYQAVPMPGGQRTAIGLVGNDGRVDDSRISGLPGVAQVIHVSKPYKQVSREWRPENTVVQIAPGVRIGGRDVVVIAGPCSVESEQQIVTAARAVRAAGGTALRGGAFKPRSSPYSFQGLGKQGLELLALARRETGLPIVTEAMDETGAGREDARRRSRPCFVSSSWSNASRCGDRTASSRRSATSRSRSSPARR